MFITSLVTKKVKIKTVKHHFHYEIVRITDIKSMYTYLDY